MQTITRTQASHNTDPNDARNMGFCFTFMSETTAFVFCPVVYTTIHIWLNSANL